MKITAAMIKAAQTLRAAARDVLPLHKLREIAQQTPRAEWHEYAEFHIFETTHWGDGTADSLSTAATFRGGHLALQNAATLLVCLRAELAEHEASGGKVRATFQLVCGLANDENAAMAWLDCEKGAVRTGKAWPEPKKTEVPQ